ncbi:chloride channel protein [Pedobacter sp. NJ-S-72]
MFHHGNAQSILHNSLFRYLEFKEWLVIIFLGLICILKAFATSITIFSGGNGGNFAPALFAGGTLGYLFAIACSYLGIPDVPITNLVLVGMAGVMSGVLYAPLTAIFLIAESSSGYDLFIPLMIVSVIAYLIARWFSPVSPDLKKMADDGKIFTREHDKNLLTLLHTEDLIDRNPQVIHKDAPLIDLLEVIKNGKKNMFAVLDTERHLVGLLTLDDMRPFLFAKDLQASLDISKMIQLPVAVIHPDDQMHEIIKTFDETGAWHLPVINDDDEFIGFISKSSVLMNYRQLLKEYS